MAKWFIKTTKDEKSGTYMAELERTDIRNASTKKRRATEKVEDRARKGGIIRPGEEVEIQ